MEPLDSFNTFAMDDPSTPLCSNSSSSPFSLYRSAPNRCPFAPTVPVCSSFDQEFQLQDNNYINMLPHNITLKSGGLAEEESPAYALHQSSEHIEFPLDLFDYLENVPFNIEQLVDQDIYRNVLCDAGSCQADTRRAPNSEVPCDQLVTPTIELVQPQQEMVEIKSENVDINMEEIYSFSPIPPYQENVPPPPPSLYLNISQTTSQTENEVSTPVIIKMLLESAEEIGQKVINSFACITFSLTLNFFISALIQKQAVVPPPVANLPQVIEDIASCDSAAEVSLPPTPKPSQRTRTTNKRATKSGGNSDLRRVRNNEASRKSRQNRRKKQQTQAQMVDVLEAEGRRLNQKVKELEALKAEIMKYMPGNRTISSSDSSHKEINTL